MTEELLITKKQIRVLTGADITICCGDTEGGVRVRCTLAALKRLFRAIPEAYLCARLRRRDLITTRDTITVTAISGLNAAARKAVRNYIIE